MLDFIRKNASSWLIKVIFGAIIIVFIFWGIGNFRATRKETIARVNGEEITIEDFQNSYKALLNRYQQMFGGSIPPEFISKLDLRKQALDNLIDLSLIRQSAKKYGIVVTDTEVQMEIMNVQDFKLNNVFNKDVYIKILTSYGITPKEFEEEVRTKILIDKMRIFLGAGINIPISEIKHHYSYENEAINLLYVAINVNHLREQIGPTHEQIVKFYEDNKEKYKTNPKVKVRYINFSKSQYFNEINITETDLISYYEENKAKFRIPERRKARHILIMVEQNATEEKIKIAYDKALDLLNQIRNGASFEEMAKKYSDDKVSGISGGELGYIEKGQLVKPFEDMLFSMQEGNVSEPVLSQFGWHIIKLDEISPEKYRAFEEVKDDIKNFITEKRLDFLLQDKTHTAYDEIVLAGSIEEYSKRNNTPLKETDFFDELNPPFNLGKEGIKSIFNLNKGSLTPILKTTDGFIIAEIMETKPSHIPQLDEIKDRVAEDLTIELKREKVREKANEILKFAEKSNIREAISHFGLKDLEIKETGLVSRKDFNKVSDIPPEVFLMGFNLTVQRPYPHEAIHFADKFYLISLKDSKKPDGEPPKDELEKIRLNMYQTRVSNVFDKWLELKRKAADIKIVEGIM